MSKADPDKLIDDPNIVGYAGVILTSAKLWQGMFIPRCEPERVENAKRVAKLGLAEAGLDQDDPKRVLHALASAVADAFQFSRPTDVGAFLAAISDIMGAKYFLIRARDAENGGGTITSVEPILAASKRAARQYFDSLPEVQLLKAITYDDFVKNQGTPKQ